VGPEQNQSTLRHRRCLFRCRMALRIPPRQSFIESAGYIFAPLRIFTASGSLERFKSLQHLVRGGYGHLVRNCCNRHRAIAALRARLPNFRLGLKLKFLAYLRKILYYPISCLRLRTQSQSAGNFWRCIAFMFSLSPSYNHFPSTEPPPRVMPSKCERVSIFQYADFNAPALCRFVSKLRGGQHCFCDTSQVPAYSSFNWTILVSFRNGVEWVLRSPRDDGAIKSDETNLLLLASEAATLIYIRANSTIPVPEVFAYR